MIFHIAAGLIQLLLATSPACAQPLIDFVTPAASLPAGDPVARDFDGDGDLDLVFGPGGLANSNPHSQWMENLGDRQFSDLKLVALSLIPANTYWAVSAPLDFDQDGNLEFLISAKTPTGWASGEALPTHQPFLFDSKHGFKPTPLAEPSIYPWIGVDLESDGQAEIVQFRGKWNESWDLAILRRNHDGRFIETATIDLITNRLELDPIAAIQMLDLDNDGDLDLSLEFNYGYHVVFRRTGPDSFDPTPVKIEATNLSSSWADLDGDGLLDLLTWNYGWMKNKGNLVFELQPRIANAEVLTRQNGSVVHIESRPGNASLLHLYLHMDDGGIEAVRLPMGASDFEFRQPIGFEEGSSMYIQSPFAWADLDGDGFLDLVHTIVESDSWREGIAVSWGSSNLFSGVVPIYQSPLPTLPLIADFNGDGLPDILTGPDVSGQFSITPNDGAGGFLDSRTMNELHRTASGESLVPRGVIGTADFNNDGILDLVIDYSTITEGQSVASVAMLTGYGDLTFSPPSRIPTKLEGVAAHLLGGRNTDFTDWDQDGDLDIIVMGMWIENEGGDFQVGNRELIALGEVGGYQGISFAMGFTLTGDLDVDGHPDVISAFQGKVGEGSEPADTPRVVVAFNDGIGGISELREIPEALAGVDALGNPVLTGDVRIEDVNGDGLPDLLIDSITGYDELGNPALSGSWRQNPGNGSRNISAWVLMPLPAGPLPGRFIADFDGDGAAEWVNFASYMRATPAGPFRSEEFDFVGGADFSSHEVRAIDDFDGDGDADFLVGGGKYSPLMLVRNPIVDHMDPLVAWMRKAGIPGAAGGLKDDADGDGRDNLAELTEGTNVIVRDDAVADSHHMRIAVDGSLGLLTYRFPLRVVGLGDAQDPVLIADLGIGFSIESSIDLLNWKNRNSGPEIMTFSDGTWNYFARAFLASDPVGYFRLRSER